MKAFIFVLLAVVFFATYAASAQSVGISTSKSVYNYGDHLAFTITVSKVTADQATLYIIDSEGVKSSAIPVPIKDLTTTITTPLSFNAEIFREGKYQLQIEYDGEKSSASFELVDAGNIVLPFGSDVIVVQWANGSVSDYMLMKFLTEKKVIEIPDGKKLGDKAVIPYWYKTNGKWWSEQKISDSEFAKGLQYLVNKKFVVV